MLKNNINKRTNQSVKFHLLKLQELCLMKKKLGQNGGTLINPKTQDTHFELTKMDPSLYSEVSNLRKWSW